MKKNLLYGLLIGGCLLASIVRIYFDYRFEPKTYAGADFPVFYVAATFIQQDKPIYHNEALFNAVIVARGSKGAVRYLYPPTALIYFIPLTWLNYSTAKWLWFCFNLIIFSTALRLFLPKLLRRSLQLRDLAIIASVCLFFSPLFTVLRSGQVNVLLMSLMLLQVWLYVKGHTKSSAIFFVSLWPLLKTAKHTSHIDLNTIYLYRCRLFFITLCTVMESYLLNNN